MVVASFRGLLDVYAERTSVMLASWIRKANMSKETKIGVIQRAGTQSVLNVLLSDGVRYQTSRPKVM